MESLTMDVNDLKKFPPFAEFKDAEFDAGALALWLTLDYPAPHDVVRIKFSKQYADNYPLGEVSMVVGNNFHLIPVGRATGVRELVFSVKELILASIATNSMLMESPGSVGMQQWSTEWHIEPTVSMDEATSLAAGGVSSVHPDLLKAVSSMQDRTRVPFYETVMQDHPTLNRVDVTMFLPLKGVVTETTAAAWNVNLREPLQLHFTFDRKLFTAAHVETKVGQSHHFSSGHFGGMAGQLRFILDGFWRQVSAEHPEETDGDPMNSLISFCGDASVARKAMDLAKGQSALALEILMKYFKEEIMDAKAEDDMVGAKKTSALDIKRVPPAKGDQSVLARAVAYVLQRIPTLNEFCIVCDRPQLYGAGGMIQASVCTRDVCVFKLQELNVARDMSPQLAVQSSVIDLLLVCAKAASTSTRWQFIFEPFPHVCTSGSTSAMSAANKDIDLAKQVLSAIPSFRDITRRQATGTVKTILDGAHPLAYPTFQWIMSSNKSLLLAIPSEHHVKFMGTQHQYVLAQAPPERQQRFAEAKEKYGSIWAFHGSRAENWHSILRNGLRNASGTKLQVNGAAYGHGIYLSPSAGVSFGYSNMSTYDNNDPAAANEREFLDYNTTHCIAICEVVNSPQLKKSGNIWVEPNEDHVITRFFFAYSRGMSKGGNTDLNQKSNMEELTRIAARYAK